jgi:hypothetical protein
MTPYITSKAEWQEEIVRGAEVPVSGCAESSPSWDWLEDVMFMHFSV